METETVVSVLSLQLTNTIAHIVTNSTNTAMNETFLIITSSKFYLFLTNQI